jgi:predicted transcriptional regulator of viral defense system
MSIDGQNAAPVNLNVFLSAHSVFTVEEVRQYLAEHGSTNPKTRKALLTYHRSKGRVLPIRRGLYVSVPPGRDPATHAVDPVLITAKLTADAVLAYHAALEYHGKAYSTYNRMVYASDTRSPTALFRGTEYIRVPHPATLRSTGNTEFGISSSERDGVTIRVTNLERTLVDVLDRPDVSGSWEEIWRSLEMVEFFDLEQVIHYAEHLANATTAAKVGFYLSQHRDALMVDDEILAMLRRMVPKQPHYMDRGKRSGGRLVPEWNILVPLEILERSWEEVL